MAFRIRLLHAQAMDERQSIAQNSIQTNNIKYRKVTRGIANAYSISTSWYTLFRVLLVGMLVIDLIFKVNPDKECAPVETQLIAGSIGIGLFCIFIQWLCRYETWNVDQLAGMSASLPVMTYDEFGFQQAEEPPWGKTLITRLHRRYLILLAYTEIILMTVEFGYAVFGMKICGEFEEFLELKSCSEPRYVTLMFSLAGTAGMVGVCLCYYVFMSMLLAYDDRKYRFLTNTRPIDLTSNVTSNVPEEDVTSLPPPIIQSNTGRYFYS